MLKMSQLLYRAVKRGERGLTLIELLIVIALVGIIAAIALPILLNVLSSAKSSATDDSNTAVTHFVNDWSQAGYNVNYIDPTDPTFGAKYGGDMVAYTDENGNNTLDSGEPVIAEIKGGSASLDAVPGTSIASGSGSSGGSGSGGSGSTGVTLFTTDFETGSTQPTVSDTIDCSGVAGCDEGITNFPGASEPEMGVRNETAHSGTAALMYSGEALDSPSDHAYFEVFDLSSNSITIGSDTELSYWIYPQSNSDNPAIYGTNSTCVAVDMVFTDGTDLRDSHTTASNGVYLHPTDQCGHLTLDTWNHVTADLGTNLNGKTIQTITVGYDQPSSTGGYRGYIDDISLTNP